MREEDRIEKRVSRMLDEAKEALNEAEKSIKLLEALGEDVTEQLKDYELAQYEVKKLEDALRIIMK